MKKILLAIPGDSSFLKPSVATFKELGWDVRNVDYRKTDFLAALKNNIKLTGSAFGELMREKRPSVKRVINNNEILRIAKRWRPDLFLTFKGEAILPETILSLRKLRIKTALWYPDDLPETTVNSRIINSFDCFVYWDPWRTKQYHKKGFKNVLYLPFATIPEKTPAPKNKKYSINFIARWQAHREAKIAPVSKLGLKIWGSKTWQLSNLRENYQGGPVTVGDMIRIIRSSKITLNVHVVEQIYSEGTNVRTFEATGAGGFLLANKRGGLYELFRVGKEIEIFDSAEELVEKTKFYLKNDVLRERIAKAGWLRARKDHTYLKRFNILLKYLNI